MNKLRQIITLAGVVWLEMVRRKELSVLLILLATLLAGLLSFDVFGLSQVTGYVKDMGLLAVWVLAWILAVNTSVRQLPQEEQRGTLGRAPRARAHHSPRARLRALWIVRASARA